MLKKIVAAVLIVLASGTWGYLDYLNKQEIKEAAELRIAMEQARAQAAARAKAAAEEARAAFESAILAELATCKATAEMANADFLIQHQKPVRRKRGQFTIPKAAMDEAAKTLEDANAACQTTYETRFKSGS